jgi:hypothetical protein
MMEFLFKYPAQAFRDSDFVLASGWPVWLLVALVLLCGILVAGALVWQLASLRWWQHGLLGSLQIAMLALVLMDHYLRHRGQNADVVSSTPVLPGSAAS